MLQTVFMTLLTVLTLGVEPAATAPADDAQARSPADPQGGHRLLLTAVSVWLAHELDVPAVHPLPRVSVASPSELLAIRLAGQAPLHAHAPEPDIAALYEDSTRTIHLGRGWNPATAAGQSLLVHEMVHHIQNLTGQRFACAEERERAAYAAQSRWLQVHGRSLESEFGIDPLTRWVRTTCPR